MRRTLLVLPMLVLAAGCGGSDADAAKPAVTVTETQVSIAPAPIVTTPPPAVVAPPAPPPVTTAPPAPVRFAMPNLVGLVLQDAQDQMQRTVGSFFFSVSHDADGQNRLQLDDANWTVCDQNVAPGTSITLDTKVDFGAVKLTEKCPK